MNLCGSSSAIPDLPDAGEGMCCYGAALGGPKRCTCWQPVHDTAQKPPRRGQPTARTKMCHDCAFRPGSPERQGDERYHGSDGKLDELAWSGEPFYCHQGLRRVVAWRHPADVEVPAGPDDYDPPVGLTMPYQADGTPAEVCAGWAARRRALEAEAPADAE